MTGNDRQGLDRSANWLYPMAMPFIGTNFLESGEDPEKRKKNPQKIEDLSVGADLDDIEKQKQQLAQASDQLRKKEQALEEDFRVRLEKESREAQRALSREQTKNELLEKQVQSSLESIDALRKERQEALARLDALEKELAQERRKAQQEDLQSHSGAQRVLALEKELERAQKLLQERPRDMEKARAEARQESSLRIQELEQRLRRSEIEGKQRVQAQESARKESAPQKLPVASPSGDMQKQFNEMAQVRLDKDGGFSGWTHRQSEDQALIVRVVQFILEQAVRTQASDIHLEPVGDFLRVRFRIDGMLSELLRVPASKLFPVIARIRVMCGLDPEQGASIAKPQEGRMAALVDGRDVDLRLSTFPTTNGDKAVLRLIYRSADKSDLAGLGFTPKTAEIIRRLIEKPLGLILVTGPAGSGKSTTLYSILQILNDASRNIVTLEDPVEMKIPGLNQCTVQPKIGFTFA